MTQLSDKAASPMDAASVDAPQEARLTDEGVCECGDWQSLHVLGRGNCRLCRFGTPPPDGPDGCQRYREAWKEQRRVYA